MSESKEMTAMRCTNLIAPSSRCMLCSGRVLNECQGSSGGGCKGERRRFLNIGTCAFCCGKTIMNRLLAERSTAIAATCAIARSAIFTSVMAISVIERGGACFCCRMQTTRRIVKKGFTLAVQRGGMTGVCCRVCDAASGGATKAAVLE